MAFATPLGEGTNNKAKLESAIFGMTWSLELGYSKIILEVDSQLVIDWIMQKIAPHWSINTQMLKIQALIRPKSSNVITHSEKLTLWQTPFQNTVTRSLVHNSTSTVTNYQKRLEHIIN